MKRIDKIATELKIRKATFIISSKSVKDHGDPSLAKRNEFMDTCSLQNETMRHRSKNQA